MTDPAPIVLGPWVPRGVCHRGADPVWRRYIGDEVAISCFGDKCWTIWDDQADIDGYGDRAAADKAFRELYPDATLEP